MIGAALIVAAGIAVMVLCFVVAYKYRGGLVPTHFGAWIMMGLGALSISLFYVAILFTMRAGESVLPLVPFSRFLFWMVLAVTTLMAFGALGFGGGNDNKDE